MYKKKKARKKDFKMEFTVCPTIEQIHEQVGARKRE